MLGNRVPRAVPRVWKATSEERLREGGLLVEEDEEEDGDLGTGRRRMGKASMVFTWPAWTVVFNIYLYLLPLFGQWNFNIYLFLLPFY